MPRYLVEPSSCSTTHSFPLDRVKIVDFGQSFPSGDIIFRDRVDLRVDIWSMGCMLFELVVGQPLFDSFMTTPKILAASLGKESACSLQAWLEEMYFDGERSEDLSRGDILQVGALIRRMLLFESRARASAKGVLQDF
ncbi:hypothetical protein EJ07DRAFT_166225 [Lizonia empirigonia]|nr:hypothetical protein EJ07DRAFT_166225 [Lizonia empirigonia]